MRLKTDSVDYKYFTEPNIPPIKLSKEFIDDAIKTSPELADVKLQRYKTNGLNDYDSNILISNNLYLIIYIFFLFNNFTSRRFKCIITS